MKIRIAAVVFALALLAAGGFLLQVDFSERIEADVARLLPSENSVAAKVLRSLISDQEGRVVYLKVAHDGEAASRETVRQRIQNRWTGSPLVAEVQALGDDLWVDAFRYADAHRMDLFFPSWLSRMQAAYREEETSVPFEQWAAERAADELDAFLTSPEAIELATPELMDPYLLAIDAIRSIADGDLGMADSPQDSGAELFFVRLAASPLEPDVQDALAALVASSEAELRAELSSVSLQYAGLARLAAESRSRIQRDVTKVNLISLIGVLFVSVVLLRKLWPVFLAVPVIAVGLLGAFVVSLLVFQQVHVIVLIVGAILIGTAVDYAYHCMFQTAATPGFPTTKLLGFACGSTVAGFSSLWFSDMGLIRQIGVFVAAGLASSYAAAYFLRGMRLAVPQKKQGAASGPWVGYGLIGLATVALLLGGYGALGATWRDDLRNLEAPDAELVAEDIALRSEFGRGGDADLVLSVGKSYSEALGAQDRFRERYAAAGQGEAGDAFVSAMLPGLDDVKTVLAARDSLAELFAATRTALAERGYEDATFAGFFERAMEYRYAVGLESSEQALRGFAERLRGPMAGLLGTDGEFYWAMARLSRSGEPVGLGQALAASEDSFSLSQVVTLNESLERLRGQLMQRGGITAGIVCVLILVGFGLARGASVLAIPALAIAGGLGLASLLVGELNFFNLIGCFLGGAIALDYALFGVEAMARRVRIPFSVWISGATTGVSFIALAFSSIPAVRALGVTVFLITGLTLLILASVRRFFPSPTHCDD